MAITKIGINFTDFNNVTYPEFNASKTISERLREMPIIANTETKYAFGWGILITLFIVIYTSVSESIGREGFGYSEWRSFALSAGITLTFGLLLVMIGYVHSFEPVGVMAGLFILGTIGISYIENKQ